MKEKEIQRTEPCPTCRMSFRIGKPVRKKTHDRTRCYNCGLMHYDGNLDKKVASVSVDSMGDMGDVERAWG